MSAPNIETLGRYKVLEMLGRGAMGVVYKAVDPAIDRLVAIKTINLTLTADELAEYEARFSQEVKAAGRLNHPNIVSVYDVGKTDDFAWMAMEFIDGPELKALMRGQKPLPMLDALDIVQQVAEALAFAHSKDVVHRDVKPSNIMITGDDERLIAKVTDFGIARMSSSAVKTMTGIVLGSPRYMSPEQVLGKKVGPPTDIFSLGVVLFEALTGAAPFDSPSINSIMYQTVHEPLSPPSTVNPQLPGELDAIVAKAMMKSPEERFASMREFARVLKDARRNLMGSATGVTVRPSLLALAASAPPGSPTSPQKSLLDPPGVRTQELDPAEVTRAASREVPRQPAPAGAEHVPGSEPAAGPATASPVPAPAAPEIPAAIPKAVPSPPAAAPQEVPAPAPIAAASTSLATDEPDPRETTRRLSRDFDSTIATRRLAALTEQIGEVERLLPKPPAASPAAAQSPPAAEPATAIGAAAAEAMPAATAPQVASAVAPDAAPAPADAPEAAAAQAAPRKAIDFTTRVVALEPAAFPLVPALLLGALVLLNLGLLAALLA
ncbi:MAG TPA: serine/threonine-protein kinase [Usitatibacteraceae bacterium]|nr:serine/threonine-protein kinase [Usitatibacteraceae bacterium]